MRKLLAAAAVVAMATPAFAGLSLDTRYDYLSGQSNSQTSSTTNYLSGFGFSRLIIAGDGKVADGVTFKAALNPIATNPILSQNFTDNNSGDSGKTASVPGSIVNPAVTGALVTNAYPSTGPNDFVSWAEVDAKISDSLTLNAGKLLDIGLGGFEGQENPGDLYFMSQGDYGASYFTGAQLQYQIADNQKVGVAFVNNNSPTDTTRSGAGAWYAGTFGAFGVRASYHQIGEGQATKGTLAFTPITVGVSYKMDDWKFTLDYDSITDAPTYTGVATNTYASSFSLAGNHKTLSDIVATAKWNLGSWTPYAKLESTSRQGYETAGTSDVTDNVLNWSLAGEYRKNAADNFRYEVAYVSSATSYGSNAAYTGQTNGTVTASAFYFGVRYLGDFLK